MQRRSRAVMRLGLWLLAVSASLPFLGALAADHNKGELPWSLLVCFL
jgi:hypothetical protein